MTKFSINSQVRAMARANTAVAPDDCYLKWDLPHSTLCSA
jgi:hypothetical protein